MAEERFLQWFETMEEALEAKDKYARIVTEKFPGWLVSQPRRTSPPRNRTGASLKGWALYAIPPEDKSDG
jgi:hypothetical protein